MFWLLSFAIVLAAGLWALWPLLQGESRFKVSGLIALLIMPMLVYWQYTVVGSPRAMEVQAIPQSAPTDASLDELIVSLREKLTETPADLEGWVLLGRTYKTMQNYPAALEALETANRLVPDEPVVLAELVEAQLFASGRPIITEDMVQTLQRAVAAQPNLQKGWWMLGLAAAQQGDDAQAIKYWRNLLQSLEPGSSLAQTIQSQIAEAEARMGSVSSVSDPDQAEAWESALIQVELSTVTEAEIDSIPSGAVLFVIARPSGETAGPPLAVRRINQPDFPLQLTLTDADSMLPQRPVSGVADLQVQARLSLSGEPLPGPGDWQSPAMNFSDDRSAALTLTIEERLE
jgi:cytochrome c-type biogenesis protein CcmH